MPSRPLLRRQRLEIGRDGVLERCTAFAVDKRNGLVEYRTALFSDPDIEGTDLANVRMLRKGANIGLQHVANGFRLKVE